MTDRIPKLSLGVGRSGVLLRMADSNKELSIDLPLSEASKFFQSFGLAMNTALFKTVGHTEDPGKTQNVIAPTSNMFAVTTHGGKTYLNIRFSDFPTMRLEVPEDALKSTAEALLQIADTPRDIRDQKTS